MTPPFVSAVMLTRTRPEMARRAIECFRKQTYPNARLLIWDTGDTPLRLDLRENEWHASHTPGRQYSIGELRNHANADTEAEIIIHWDDDDWSHPHRIEDQVGMLQMSNVDAAGYHDCLFWDQAKLEAWVWSDASPIRNQIVGTSLCYWRRAWEARPFNPNLHTGEDSDFVSRMSSVSVTSMIGAPRIIASIHGGNTSSHIEPGRVEWNRTPEWDSYCRANMNYA